MSYTCVKDFYWKNRHIRWTFS